MPSDPKQRLAALSDEQRQLLARRLIRGKGHTDRTITRQSRDSDLFPLSSAQQRIWFLSQLDASNTALNIGRPIRLRGPLHLDALTRSLNEMIRRHESLRTIFPAADGVPRQRVLPFSERRLDLLDVRHVPVADRGHEVLRQITEVYHEPWFLETGPLVRSKVWRLADDDHVLLVLIHHILADGWSWGLVETELTALYRAFSAGQPSPLSELPIQYPDFAVWHNRWVETPDCDHQIDYWKRQFAELPTMALLRDRGASGPGITQQLSLSEDLTRSLKALCRREGATLFMGLMAAFATLLSRYTGQDDLVIGSPIANRNRAELENVIGCFMNPLPVRIDISGRPSFATLLQRVRDVSLSVYAHQDVPFDRLVRALQPKRDPTSPPLFQAMLLLQNYPWQPVTLSNADNDVPGDDDEYAAELSFDKLHTDLVYPAAIEAYERGSFVLCIFQYESAFTTILSRAPEHFRLLLQGAMADPERAIADLPMLTPAEEDRLLLQPREASPAAPLVHRRFEEQATFRPDAIAVLAADRSITYGDLNARAHQLAHHLRAIGVTRDSRVGILLRRSPEMITAMLAVLKAGGAYVPLDPAYPEARLAFFLSDSGSTVLLTTADLLDQFPDLVPNVAVVCLDTEAEALSRLDGTTPIGEPEGANLAYVIYTSGSTGVPKGVQVTHKALANYTQVASEAFGLDPTDRVLQFASISFDTAAEEIYPCFARGASLVLRSDATVASVPQFLTNCREWGITVLDLPTAYWHELTNEIARYELTLPETVRLVILGGERAHSDCARAWQARFGHRVRLLNTYGPTEATIVTTMHDVPPADPSAATDAEIPIGRPIPNSRVYVLDRHLRPTTIGAPGELHIGGVGLSRGYLHRPDLTAEKFIPDPFGTDPGDRLYKTGDLARYLEDGTIEFLGRVDHQIKLRGHRIELSEIEAALMRDPAVQDAIVTLRDDGATGKRLVGYVVPRGATLTAGDLRRSLRDTLPDYMVPSSFVLLDSLPLTPSGKIDRDALPIPEGDRQSEEAYAAPQTELQTSLTSLWQELLGVQRVGIDDNFFDLGGHSLLVLQLHSRLHAAVHDAPSVVDLFKFSTVRALADQLSGRDGGQALAGADEIVRVRAERQRDAFRRRRQKTERGVIA